PFKHLFRIPRKGFQCTGYGGDLAFHDPSAEVCVYPAGHACLGCYQTWNSVSEGFEDRERKAFPSRGMQEKFARTPEGFLGCSGYGAGEGDLAFNRELLCERL